MANPFLMSEPEMGETRVSDPNASFNPFLAGNDLSDASYAENPFMNVFASAGNKAYESADPNPATNPFAFGPESESNANDFFSSRPEADDAAEINYESIFSSTLQPGNAEATETFDDFKVPSDSNASLIINRDRLTEDPDAVDVFATDPTDRLTGSDSGASSPKGGGVPPPRRPPPPRPFPPKETKDLILSVTGAMEATSSHLLDRLRATRTPSPTPMRDLHSPSPTQFGDLLEVDEPVSGVQEPPDEPREGNLLGDFDFSVSPSPVVAQLPQEPVRAQEPMIDMSEPEPITPVSPMVEAAPPVAPPSRPLPPAVPGRPKLPPQPARPPPPAQPLPEPGPEPEPEPEPTPEFAPDVVQKDVGFADIFGPESRVAPPTREEEKIKTPDVLEVTTNIGASPFDQPTSELSNKGAHVTDNIDDAFEMDFTNRVDCAPAQDAFDIFGNGADRREEIAARAACDEDFDAFTAKFESAGFDESKSADPFDPFGGNSAFGATPAQGQADQGGFGGDDNFDSFLALREPPPAPQGTPARISRGDSVESDTGNDFNIFIKPKAADDVVPDVGIFTAALAPPPKSPVQPVALQDTSPRFNPFDNTQEPAAPASDNLFAQVPTDLGDRPFPTMERTDSHETPPTPLFDEDVSQPLEDFPRIHYEGPGWEMQLRQPNKKKITGQRFWKKIFLRLVFQGENPVLQLFNNKDDKDPFQELPLQPCYSVSEIGAQQYDQYGKIFTVKLQFIFYKERPGVRPGQVTKAERITNKLSQFAAYAIQGDYQGVKEFGSDLKKLGLPVEHAPQISQLFKIGSHSFEDMKQFSMCVEEALFRLSAHRDRALNYKMEEVQITAVDELYVEQNAYGAVEKQIARVRLFFLGFLSGMPDVELGVNDLVRQGKEVVGRHDIIPVVTEEWIRLEGVEFHSCVQQDEYEKTRTIRFKPPDACYIELMRFRIRPPRNRELPLQVKCTMCVTGNKVELHVDILVPGFTSRKLGQIPCEDVMVRIPIPECWIYLFRVEKHFRYGSVKSAHRRTGKIKGIERILGAVDNLEASLMEVTSGQAKYEHQHRAIVWRMPRLPKEGQGAYTTHNLVCRMALTSFDQIPEELAKYCYVEFTMPATTVSHTTVRSVSIANSDSDTPPEKYVRQLSRHEYRVEIEHTQGEGPGDYIAATVSKPAAIPEEPRPVVPAPAPESDSDSSG